ncbi:MAG: hypothetical protein KA383_15620 [Phycisphaerae bacterium]|nr:hypothetical protein [Phycisphaerae bacterium]
MTRKSKWLALSVLLAGGSTLFAGCLSAFWQGFFNTGWPSDNVWLNLALDVVKEATIYAP